MKFFERQHLVYDHWSQWFRENRNAAQNQWLNNAARLQWTAFMMNIKRTALQKLSSNNETRDIIARNVVCPPWPILQIAILQASLQNLF